MKKQFLFITLVLLSLSSKAHGMLHSAVEYNRYTEAHILLSLGWSPNERLREKGKKTPLYIAVEKNLPDMVKLLMSYGADWRIHDSSKRTSFDVAVNNESTDILDIFAQVGDKKQFIQHATLALTRAARNNKKNSVRWLLAHEAEADGQYEIPGTNIAVGTDTTPLEAAACEGHDDIIDMLLDYNAPIGNALSLVAIQGQHTTIDLLLRHSNARISMHELIRVLGHAARSGKTESALMLLWHAQHRDTNSSLNADAAKASELTKDPALRKILTDETMRNRETGKMLQTEDLKLYERWKKENDREKTPVSMVHFLQNREIGGPRRPWGSR